MINIDQLDLTINGLHDHYQRGDFTPRELIHFLLQEAVDIKDNPVWIQLLNSDDVEPYLSALENKDRGQSPLYGVPFAIKDNIDLAGIPTTAGCREFAFVPETSAFVVEQLIAAGAIPLGKTNMDQFATGLVGTRSPYGVCKNAFNDQYISGGSSSGSAVAVALGLVSFALGTDTAGSGRVPAALNNIVGVKPSRGLVSTSGVIPACRSLDCVSIFALTTSDANTVLNAATRYDIDDPFARPNRFGNGPNYYSTEPLGRAFTVGIPNDESLEFFGNKESEKMFETAKVAIEQAGGVVKPIDFAPFLEAATLLYDGPWVTERYLATQPLIDTAPESLLEVTRSIILGGADLSARDVFTAQYQLQSLKQKADAAMADCDVVMTPTCGTTFTIAAVNDDPIRLNSQLGYYTNFMNLLDYAAVSVPIGFYKSGVGFGVTLFHHALTDKFLLTVAAQLQQQLRLRLGKTRGLFKPSPDQDMKEPQSWIEVVVCGAHMEGLSLNWQLQQRGARFAERTQTSTSYRLVSLTNAMPARPGMIRVYEMGEAIDVEVWHIPISELGSFLAEIPFPLGLGKVELSDGRWCTGFICEANAVKDAEDITAFGGWREYLNSLANENDEKPI